MEENSSEFDKVSMAGRYLKNEKMVKMCDSFKSRFFLLRTPHVTRETYAIHHPEISDFFFQFSQVFSSFLPLLCRCNLVPTSGAATPAALCHSIQTQERDDQSTLE